MSKACRQTANTAAHTCQKIIGMNINYDVLFKKNTDKADLNFPQKLLLHACCAPCSTYCLTQVLPYYDVTLYYANDNITDRAEWEKRLGELAKLTDIVNKGEFATQPITPLKLAVRPIDAQRYYSIAKGLETQPEGGARCTECFKLRLADTARYAQDNGFDLFGTTLSVSPYKNSSLLNEIGVSLQSDCLKWLYADFKKRNGYGESIRLSSLYGLYRQHYCGCDFSLIQARQHAETDN